MNVLNNDLFYQYIFSFQMVFFNTDSFFLSPQQICDRYDKQKQIE